MFVAGCAVTSGGQIDVNGNRLPDTYNINAAIRADIPQRMLEDVNARRKTAGLSAVVLNSELSKAATLHSADMSRQNRPWHFSSNGMSPLQRVVNAGFTGVFLGEVISETYETEVETVAVWFADMATRTILQDPDATQLGVGFYQDKSGKLWWTLVLGA